MINLNLKNKGLLKLEHIKFAMFSLVKEILEQDPDISLKIKNKEKIGFSIFDSNKKEVEEFLTDSKFNLYYYLNNNSFNKLTVLALAKNKNHKNIKTYYNMFYKIYDEFGINNKTHIPVLFATYVLYFLKKKGLKIPNKAVFDVDHAVLALKYKSQVDKDEKEIYNNLIQTMYHKAIKYKGK